MPCRVLAVSLLLLAGLLLSAAALPVLAQGEKPPDWSEPLPENLFPQEAASERPADAETFSLQLSLAEKPSGWQASGQILALGDAAVWSKKSEKEVVPIMRGQTVQVSQRFTGQGLLQLWVDRREGTWAQVIEGNDPVVIAGRQAVRNILYQGSDPVTYWEGQWYPGSTYRYDRVVLLLGEGIYQDRPVTLLLMGNVAAQGIFAYDAYQYLSTTTVTRLDTPPSDPFLQKTTYEKIWGEVETMLASLTIQPGFTLPPIPGTIPPTPSPSPGEPGETGGILEEPLPGAGGVGAIPGPASAGQALAGVLLPAALLWLANLFGAGGFFSLQAVGDRLREGARDGVDASLEGTRETASQFLLGKGGGEMRCRRCRAVASPGARFCPYCGTRLKD
ncbi:MAG: zinc ribbon domain-containing protein [Coprothermobacterota bacterium]|nr:zinc ribbon domain-containing protein [Coprothermobacterota bacterium]